MSRHRMVASLLALSLVPVFSVLPATPAAAVDTPLQLCSAPSPPPCVVSIKEEGVDKSIDPGFTWFALLIDDGTTKTFNFRVDDTTGDPFSLDPTKLWEVVINTGPTFPMETFARGREVMITRAGDATSGYTVGFEMYPTHMSYGDACDNMGNCSGDPTTNTDATGYLEGWIDDAGFAADPDYRASLRGFDLASNAAWVSSPLQLDFDTRTIVLDVANTHFHKDGTTVFNGFAEFKLPFAMLRNLYLVDDPASLTAGAFRVATGSGAAPTVDVTVGASSVLVEIRNITFSKRRLKISGDTRPGRPRDLRAARRTRGKGVLRWRPALSRGSKVRGYRAVCVFRAHKITKHVNASPAVITGLRAGKAYNCSVRAKSRAGLGRIATVKIRARP